MIIEREFCKNDIKGDRKRFEIDYFKNYRSKIHKNLQIVFEFYNILTGFFYILMFHNLQFIHIPIL